MKFRSLNLVLLFLLLQSLMVGGVIAQSSSCDDNLDYTAQAQAALEQDDFESAMQAYGCALESDPLNPALRIERLSSAVLAGGYMTAYSDVFLLNNTTPEAVLTHLDELLNRDGQHKRRAFLAIFAVIPDYELALSDVEHILNVEPDSAFAYVIRAAAYEGLEDFDTAAAAFNQAVELSPDDAQVYGLMAAAQFSMFNIPAIRDNASRAIDLDPAIPQLYRLRGFTSMVMGEPQAAIEDADRAIELDPDYFAYHILRGNAYRAIGSSESALADYDQVIALVPQSSFGYALRAELRMQMGDTVAAAEDLKTAIELDTLERIDGEPLVVGNPVTLTMSFGRAYDLPFYAQQGDLLSLSAASVEQGAVDPVILVIDPDGTPLTFNDDADPDNDVLDSMIVDFAVPVDGTYTLVVSHAHGGSEGDILVLVDPN
jgi:tetratricopeptide (TPR) repeat protein